MKAKLATVAIVLVASGDAALAQTFSDDFDRPNGTNMGPDWSEVAGDHLIASNRGSGTSGNSLMLHASGAGDYVDALAQIVVAAPIDAQLRYVSIVLADGGARNLFTKLQDNNSDGQYDTIYFYSNDNGTAYGTSPIATTAPVGSCRMIQYVTNDGDTMNVDLDVDFDGVVDQHYESSGILAFASQLGTGLGIGTFGPAEFDDWTVTFGAQGIAADVSDISAFAGGTQTIVVDPGDTFAALPYLLLGSVSGTSPGLPLDGLVLPLIVDQYMFHTLLTPNQPPLAGSLGLLSAAGDSSATFTVPPQLPPIWVGTTFYHAYVVLEATPTLLRVVYASDFVSALIVP